MAIQKSIIDDFGATHAASYTRIRKVVLTTVSVVIEILLYHNAAARSKADLTAEKPFFSAYTFTVTGSDFTTYFAEAVLDDVNKTLLKQAYAYIKTQTAPINLTTGTTDV